MIIPALDAGKIVILDRFFDSTTAYQGYGRGIDFSLLQSIISISTCGIVPDITFYLDIEPEEAMRRKFSKTSILSHLSIVSLTVWSGQGKYSTAMFAKDILR